MRRNPSFWRRLDAASRHAWPASFMVFGLFIIGLPLGLPAQAELRPAYAMACVFFWSLYRPTALPAPIVALTGILLDLLGLSPLGLWAVLLLLLQGSTLAARRRLAPQAFLVTWLSFFGLSALFSGLSWAFAVFAGTLAAAAAAFGGSGAGLRRGVSCIGGIVHSRASRRRRRRACLKARRET